MKDKYTYSEVLFLGEKDNKKIRSISIEFL